MKLKILTVGEVNNYLKKTIDNDFILNNVKVIGEISNLKIHSSGHIYFSLKDESSKINCIIFRDNAVNLDFVVEEGMQVEINGRISLYIKEGLYNLHCYKIKKAGVGELFEKFQKLKYELKSEGIFEDKYKKNIPSFPKRIGVITSETGAAIRDIITVIKRRNKNLEIVLYPALVQGNCAVDTLIDGIIYFNTKTSVDVIIIGRGGGSIEELWAFNNRDLAYEIFNSNIPIVSAVGHEVDYTICDFVSDIRAATPSAAAELVSPNLFDIMSQLNYYNNHLNAFINTLISSQRNKLQFLERILKSNNQEKIIDEKRIILKHLEKKLNYSTKNIIEKNKSKILNLNNILITLNPINVLERGYTLIMDKRGHVISSIEEFKKQKEVNIKMQDGSADVEVIIKNLRCENGKEG